MDIISWSDKISVNNVELDNQHKYLIELTNKLNNCSKLSNNNEILNETLSELIAYAKFHFKSEEDLFELHNYPYIEKHKKTHRQFVYKIAMFCKDVELGKGEVIEELIVFLLDWLIIHTSGEDQDYKNFIK